MTYEPKPIDTSSVTLPDTLADVLERLAEHKHEIWARRRIAEGWRYGSVRDDAGKLHPDLVPYAELAETEKEYDRETAVEVLKAAITLGYRIDSE